MKTKRVFLFIYLFFFPVTIAAYPRSPISATVANNFPLTSSPDYGVSNYNITQSVKYNVDINFTLTQKSSGLGNYIFKFARLNNRMPNSTVTQYTPPYQESNLLYNHITGYSALDMGHHDKFNNTYDSFNATLGIDQEVTLSQNYIIELNAIKFQDIQESEIGLYNYADEIFDLYCNNTEPYYERDNAELILLSNTIVGPTNISVVEKAQKIYTWVTQNLVYNGGLPAQEMGAYWAYSNSQGDCSEYSSLMVTLLRIQDIPARKVTGFLISNNPATRPQVGDSWSFYASELENNILGHAWVEYYVPEIGWIVCDPTWGTSYFNKIDFLRFNQNIGANFFLPPSFTVSEFGNPIFVYPMSATFTYGYEIDITVIESNLSAPEPFPIAFLIFIGIGVVAVLLTIGIIIKRNRKKNLYA
ncbi:MAG: transglutaminase-like domain-containing protein [Promethearchaeota archaeon]